tara:strand:+ start:303 stop:992 length:690 start_codon:yes stop_codon:yes gene_type:complete
MSGTVVISLYQQKVQTGEKFRIDLSKTFAFPGRTISTITIKPVQSGSESYNITTDKFLDFSYSSSGTKTIEATLTLDDASTVVKTDTIEVVTEATEGLFSKDADLISLEPDILSYLPEYKADYKYAHRVAQDTIVKWLDENGLKDTSGNKFTASALVHKEEVQRWSKFLTLELIFQSLSNAIDDFFSSKSLYYRDLKEQAMQRTYISLDTDGDGKVEKEYRKFTGNLFR